MPNRSKRLVIRTASPTTRAFFRILEFSGVPEKELSEKTGNHPNTFYGWRTGKNNPTIFTFESALSVLGYELVIKPIDKSFEEPK